MDTVRRTLCGGLLGLLVCAACGCQMFENALYELQPHRLHRLNRGPGISSDAYYSVADPVGERITGQNTRD